jgi:hypothetical protein
MKMTIAEWDVMMWNKWKLKDEMEVKIQPSTLLEGIGNKKGMGIIWNERKNEMKFCFAKLQLIPFAHLVLL